MHEDAIARLRELLAKADAKDVWMLATSNSWKRVLTIFGKPVIVPCVDHDGHPNMDSLANIELAIAAVNALPELLAIAEGAEALRSALRAFMAHVEKSQRIDQHNPYSARELHPEMFAQADAALAGAVTQGEG